MSRSAEGAVLFVVLLTGCGGAPVARDEPAQRDEIELHVSRCCSTEPWTYRIVSPAGVHECVEHPLVTEMWQCTTTVPRGVNLQIVGPGSAEWSFAVAEDAVGAEVRVDQGAADRPVFRVWIEIAVDRELAGVTLDYPAMRLVNRSTRAIVPGGFDLEPTTHLESLGSSGWEEVATGGSACPMGPDDPPPLEPGAAADLDAGRGARWLAARNPPPGPFRVATYVAVVIEPGSAYRHVEPRITERYTVSAPLETLEDYAGVLGAE